MNRTKVAAVQMNALRDDLEGNLEIHAHFSREAAADDCDIVMFPELSVTAHFGHTDATKLSEPADRGRIHDTFLDLSKRLNIVICYGFCEEAHGTFYNSQALMSPKGLVGVQRKVHASNDEYFHFRMSRDFDVFDLGFCRVGILICYDVTFFESWRVMALKGAEVLLLPHASRSGWGSELPLDKQQDVIKNMLGKVSLRNTIYSADNGVYGVYANQYGFNGHSTHSGGVYITAPDETMLAKGRPVSEPQMVTAVLEPQLLHDIRSRSGMQLKARRPEVYGDLTMMI